MTSSARFVLTLTESKCAVVKMYRKDFIQKKKKQAIRRLSQSGKKLSPSSVGKHTQKDAKGGGTVAVRGGIRGRGQRGRLGGNPFLKTVGTMPPPRRQPQSSQNPFLAQIAKQEIPVLSSSLANQAGPPPSYAAVVSGHRQGQQQAMFPVPSFIAHGPNSIPVSISDPPDDIHANPFLGHQLVEPPPPPPPAIVSDNPFLTNMFATHDSSHILPSFQSNQFGPQDVVQVQGGDTAVGPVLQTPLPTGGLFGTGMEAHSGVNQSDVFQGSNLISEQYVGGASSANKALHVKGIPEELNNPVTLKKHFSQFGEVARLRSFPQKRYATVEFVHKESSILAKKQGRTISPHHDPVQIFWHSGRPSQGATAKVGSRPTVPKGALLQDGTVQEPVIHRSNLVWDPRISATEKNVEQRGRKFTNQQEKGSSTVEYESSSGTENVQEFFPTVSQHEQPRIPLEAVAHEAKKQRMGRAASPPKVEGKSIWERLGKKMDGGDSSHLQQFSTPVQQRGTSKTVQAKMAAVGEGEWMPEGGWEGEEEESDEEEDEGVFEGKNAIASLGNQSDADAMDTIARSAHHPYYLRSLHQPGSYPGPKAPISTTAVAQRPLPTSCLPAPSYDIPIPTLPSPPPPKGDTAGDYYDALHARDLEIRKGMVRQTSLMKARAIVGTCPDMCPEKERYGRESQRRLSWFELQRDFDPSNPHVDHARAIKEYSGSAADKEEPLPHDLRPLGVLCMTMDYIVTSVMDEGGEGRWAEWYDFVWNRTRAIRKDITLQHLCEPECVELTEKCARFHILCAHLLCEEDMSSFDPKLNNENLTKCMLSLKEFYRDLRTEQGLHCPYEAEFCCYDILLHLNDGSVLNLVQQYSDHVWHSPEVRFAVDTALAVDSNNFVKFFRLAESTTFLNACIMHRYFNQVCVEGLRVLNRAYSVQKRPLPFPLTDLKRMLKFEGEQEAAEFCKLHNLSVTKKSVQFTRGGFVAPEQALPIQRSPNLVESKSTKCLGEVVQGGPLPPPPIHTPYCSFTAKLEQARESTPEPTPQPSYSEEDVVAVLAVAEDLVLSEETRSMAVECLQEAQAEHAELISQVSALLCEEVEGEVVGRECKEVAQGILLEAIKQRDYEREQASLREETAQTVASILLNETTAVEMHMIAQESFRQSIFDAQVRDSALSHTCCSVLEEGVCGVAREVAMETLKLVKQEKREKLEALKRQFLTRQLGKSWGRWCHMVKVRQHVRQSALDIPPLPPLVPLSWQLEMLRPVEKRRRLEWPLDPVTLQDHRGTTSEMLGTSRAEIEEQRRAFLAPLNLPLLLQDALLSSRPPTITPSPSSQHPTTPHTPRPHDVCWQLLLLHSSHQQMNSKDTKILEWLKGKLKFQYGDPGEAISKGGIETISVSTTQIQTRAARRLQVTIKAACGGVEEEEEDAVAVGGDAQDGRLSLRRELHGTSAVLLYIPTPKADQSPEAFTTQVLSQISEVVMPLPDSSSLPLLVLCCSAMEQEYLAHWIKLRIALNQWVQHSVISDIQCQVLSFPSNTRLTDDPEQQVCAGLQWLAEHSPPQPHLLSLPLREFLEQVLLDHFVPLVVAESEKRRKSGLPSQPPSPIIALCNATLDHAIHRATDPRLKNVSWPVPDFAPAQFTQGALPPIYWNSAEYHGLLLECIAGLKLPTAGGLSLTEGCDWFSQCAQCLQYVGLIHSGDDQTSLVPLLSRIKSILREHSKSKSVAGHMTQNTTNQSHCSIPWDQVILACVEHMLNHTSSDLWVACFQDNEKEFTVPSEWLRAQAETTLAWAAREARNASRRERHHRRHRSDPSLLTPHLPTPITVDVSPLARDVRQQLETSLRREKALSQSFENQLQQWMSPTANSPPCSVPLTPRTSAPSWDGSLKSGLELLRTKTKIARWQDSADSVYFKTLSK